MYQSEMRRQFGDLITKQNRSTDTRRMTKKRVQFLIETSFMESNLPARTRSSKTLITILRNEKHNSNHSNIYTNRMFYQKGDKFFSLFQINKES